MIWAGIMMDICTNTNVIEISTGTAARYKNEILKPYVYLFRGAVGPDFILMDVKSISGKLVYSPDGLASQISRSQSYTAYLECSKEGNSPTKV
ncbi:hypothetical protein TNCV_349691 [Trichonephila clavipes]|nr:hypothetical protein TNCV_349691 [Trichonephila clavipes]